jgi:hypothetical protein
VARLGEQFAHWVTVHFGQSFENYQSSHPLIFGLIFCLTVKFKILTKMRWATFWAIFSQTHLVTLDGAIRQTGGPIWKKMKSKVETCVTTFVGVDL